MKLQLTLISSTLLGIGLLASPLVSMAASSSLDSSNAPVVNKLSKMTPADQAALNNLVKKYPDVFKDPIGLGPVDTYPNIARFNSMESKLSAQRNIENNLESMRANATDIKLLLDSKGLPVAQTQDAIDRTLKVMHKSFDSVLVNASLMSQYGADVHGVFEKAKQDARMAGKWLIDSGNLAREHGVITQGQYKNMQSHVTKQTELFIKLQSFIQDGGLQKMKTLQDDGYKSVEHVIEVGSQLNPFEGHSSIFVDNMTVNEYAGNHEVDDGAEAGGVTPTSTMK